MSKLLGLWDDLTGVVLDYALSTPPSSEWLMCYGQALEPGVIQTRRLRAKLLADGSPHGVDGAGNPKVPDARGRTTAGKDDMGGAAAGRLTTAGAAINGAALGAAGGAQTHILTVAQMPAHAHGVYDPGHAHGVNDPTHAHGVYDPAHSHHVNDPGHSHGINREPLTSTTGSQYRVNGAGDVTTTGPSLTGIWLNAAVTGIGIYGSATGISIYGSGTSISIQDNGSGDAHSITQPTLVLNKIIRL